MFCQVVQQCDMTCANANPPTARQSNVCCPVAYTLAYSPCAPRPTDPVPRGQLWPTGSVGAGHRVRVVESDGE